MFADRWCTISAVTYDWTRLADAIRARRTDLGLTQAQLATKAGVATLTVRNLEGGRQFTRIAPSLVLVENALGWEAGSARSVLEGGEPTLVSESVNGRAPNVTGGADEASEIRGLPAGIRAALSEGEHLAGDVIDLSEPGDGFRLIVVAQRGMYQTAEDIETLRKQMKEWMRIQSGIRRLIEHPENTQANDGE
jgi:transcriptional regulator with XRE-family HTH domain